MISILVNGSRRQVPVGCTVKQLLEELEMRQSAIAVEVNAEICSADDFENLALQDADQIEIVSLVGGG